MDVSCAWSNLCEWSKEEETRLESLDAYLDAVRKEVGTLPAGTLHTEAKSNVAASQWKELGNHQFKAKQYTKAIEFYNEMVCLGEGSAVGVAYANKGLCWSMLGDASKAIDNIDLAFENSYPLSDQYKLFARRGKQLLELQEFEKASADFTKALSFATLPVKERKELLTLLDTTERKKSTSTKNAGGNDDQTRKEKKKATVTSIDAIPGYLNADKVELRETETFGRHYVSASCMQGGETLLHCEPPYAKVLFPSHVTSNCHSCGKALHHIIFSCSSCHRARYCSLPCREAELRFHQNECGSDVFHVAPSYLVLALRIVLRSWLIDKRTNNEEEKKSREIVSSLDLHLDDYPVPQVYKYAREATVAYDIISNKLPTLSTTPKDIFHHILQVQTNAFAVVNLTSTYSGNSAVVPVQEERIGLAIYPRASFFNHSCVPNAMVSYLGFALSIRCCGTVNKGEQLFISYGVDASRMREDKERKKVLSDKFFFNCACPSCTSDQEKIPREQEETAATDRIIENLILRANDFLSRDQLLEARACFLDSKSLCASLPSKRLGIEFSISCDGLARISVLSGDLREAIGYLEEGLEALESVYGSSSVEVGREMFKLCQLYFNTMQGEKALFLVERARGLLCRFLGEEDEDVRELDEMKRTLKAFMAK